MRSGYASLLLTVALALLPAAAFAVDIGTLHCNDANGNNSNIGLTVEVTGVVTQISNTATYWRFYVQDATGGINVYGVIPTGGYCPSLGDNLTVTGTIAQYRGLAEVAGTVTVVFNSAGNPDPVPPVLTPAQVNATFQADYCEPQEGMLVQLGCVYIRMPDGTVPPAGTLFATGNNYRLVDAFDANSYCIMYIPGIPSGPICPAPQPLIGQPIPLTCLSVTGIVTQYDNSSPYTSVYEIYPRLPRDFVPCAATPAQSTSWGRIKTLYR
jgi:hypothetical protein